MWNLDNQTDGCKDNLSVGKECSETIFGAKKVEENGECLMNKTLNEIYQETSKRGLLRPKG